MRVCALATLTARQSARPLRPVTSSVAVELGLSGPIIALQGAVAYDSSSDQRLLATPLAVDTALQAYDYLKERGFHLQLYYGDTLYLDEIDDRARYYLKLSRVAPVVVPNLRQLLTAKPPAEVGPMKVLGVNGAETVAATIPALAQQFGSSANVFKSLPIYLEVTNPNANKGYALRWLAQLLEIPLSETAAIGDSDNDVPMLRAAGRSFVVANATKAAKEAAREVVAAQGLGVAQALQLLLGERASEPA